MLRRTLRRVWNDYGNVRPVPRLDFGPGTPAGNTVASFCDWGDNRRIELVEGERTLAVLIHEVVHALGYGTHGKRFVNKYIEILSRYAKCDEGALRLGAKLFKVAT